MPSLSTSEPLRTAESAIVSIRDLNLVFTAESYQTRSWRELFTRAAADPVGVLLAEKERLHILKNITFDVHRGDRLGLLGINGAGKSSLCRCIAGHYTPHGGQLDIRGKVRAFFDTALGIQPELTGRENAELLACFLFPEEPDLEELVEEALEFSELGKFVDIPFRNYSNGMQARLCLSIVSARPSDLLILDEVFDGADAFFREKIAKRVLNLIANSGGVVFVSHSPEQMRVVCNRLILLHEGRVDYDGPVEPGIARYQALGPGWGQPAGNA